MNQMAYTRSHNFTTFALIKYLFLDSFNYASHRFHAVRIILQMFWQEVLLENLVVNFFKLRLVVTILDQLSLLQT